MRHLELHRPSSSNELLAVTVDDHPAASGPGFTRYTIHGFDASCMPFPEGSDQDAVAQLRALLSHGDAGPSGQGGITVESLLAICCDRLGGPHGSQTPNHQLVWENLNAALLLQRKTTPQSMRGENEANRALPA